VRDGVRVGRAAGVGVGFAGEGFVCGVGVTWGAVFAFAGGGFGVGVGLAVFVFVFTGTGTSTTPPSQGMNGPPHVWTFAVAPPGGIVAGAPGGGAPVAQGL